MLHLKTAHCAWAAALTAVLACCAAAQTSEPGNLLAKAQNLHNLCHFRQAQATYMTLLRDLRNTAQDRRMEAAVLNSLGVDEQDIGDYAAAETAFNHGLAAFHATAADDPIAIALKTHLAELYIAETRPEDAEPLLRNVVAALRSSTQPDPLALAAADVDLAVVDTLRRKLAEPEGLLRQSQALLEKEFGPNSAQLSPGLLTYAGLLTAERRYTEAVDAAERAWQILSGSPAPIPKPDLASALSTLGAVYFHAGRIADAEPAARRSVELAEESLGLRHPRLGLYLGNYAAILKRLGQKDEAKASQKRADEILDRNCSTGSGYTINAAALR